MGFGLFVSVLLHAGLLAWALLNFHATPPLKLPDEIPVEVSIISQIDLETRQKKGDSLSKIEEAAQSQGKAPSPKDAPKPKPVRAVEPPPPAAAEPPPPPAPEPPKAEPPPPQPKSSDLAALIEKTAPPPDPEGPSLEEKKKLEEKIAEQQRQDEAKKAAEAKAKAEADAKAKAEAKAKADALKKKLAEDKKKREDAEKKKAAEKARNSKSFEQQMADLLNKVPDQPSAAQGSDTPPTKPTTAKGPTAGTKTGTDTVNKARAEQMIVAMLTSAFEQCWNKPLAGGGVPAPVVTLKWNLNPDGTLQGEPKVVQSDKSNPLADQAERSALRAVQTCAPFQLPQEQYGMWREITWKFNPNQTL